jgi:hypothetical protein
VSTDQPGVTAASQPAVPPSLFDEPGNGNGLVTPTRRHRFVPEEGDTSDALEIAEIATPHEAPSERLHEAPHELTKKEAKRLGQLRARKVRRTVRHIDPWSVLKLSLLFYFCLFVIVMVAGTILWNLASAAGTIGSVESFFKEIGVLDTFNFQGGTIFRATFLGGLVLVIAGAALNVLMTVLFNLISDLVGGIRVTVLEEDSARPMAAEGEAPRR